MGLAELIPQAPDPVPEGMPAGMFAQDQSGLADSHGFRLHDLVSDLFFEHSVLVDARLMGEGVGPYDGLVGRHLNPGNVGQKPLEGKICSVMIPTSKLKKSLRVFRP